jgi:hypothetical protein
MPPRPFKCPQLNGNHCERPRSRQQIIVFVLHERGRSKPKVFKCGHLNGQSEQFLVYKLHMSNYSCTARFAFILRRNAHADFIAVIAYRLA